MFYTTYSPSSICHMCEILSLIVCHKNNVSAIVYLHMAIYQHLRQSFTKHHTIPKSQVLPSSKQQTLITTLITLIARCPHRFSLVIEVTSMHIQILIVRKMNKTICYVQSMNHYSTVTINPLHLGRCHDVCNFDHNFVPTHRVCNCSNNSYLKGQVQRTFFYPS